MFNQSPKNIIVAGHRGMASRYPENTMVGFKAAVSLGVDMIETDISMTKDGHLVIMHDATVDRTTNGTGKVRDIDLKDFLALDAGCKFDPKFADKGIHPPTLMEFLEYIVTTNITLNIEIKDKTFETVDATINMLDSFGLKGKYVIACFDANIVQYAHQKFGVPTQGFPSFYMTNFSNQTYSNMYSVGISMEHLSKELCDSFRQQGLDAWGYCPDTSESALKALNAGVSLVTCNDPEPALVLYRKMGVHN